MAKRKEEGFFGMCGQELFVYCSAYTHTPFVDGRRYKELCHLCYEVPKMSDWDEKLQRIIHYPTMDPKRLCTVAELMDGGWDKKDCETSLKAVKKAIANSKPTSDPNPIPTPPVAKKRGRPAKVKIRK